jgi:hypothetical protein
MSAAFWLFRVCEFRRLGSGRDVRFAVNQESARDERDRDYASFDSDALQG